jgi:hypothetical protein
MPFIKIQSVGKHCAGLWTYVSVLLAIQENAQDTVLKLSGHGMVIHANRGAGISRREAIKSSVRRVSK